MTTLPKLLLAAALLLGVVGLVVAVVQPGDLGGDGDTETAQPGVTETETEPDGAASTSTTAPGTTATTAAPPTTAGTVGSTGGDGSTTTTTTRPAGAPSGAVDGSGGSGLRGDGDTPSDLEDGLADTGGTVAVGAALLLALAGLALRPRRA